MKQGSAVLRKVKKKTKKNSNKHFMKELAVVNGVLPECISTLASRIVTVPLLGPVLKEGTFLQILAELFNVKGETYVI